MVEKSRKAVIRPQVSCLNNAAADMSWLRTEYSVPHTETKTINGAKIYAPLFVSFQILDMSLNLPLPVPSHLSLTSYYSFFSLPTYSLSLNSLFDPKVPPIITPVLKVDEESPGGRKKKGKIFDFVIYLLTKSSKWVVCKAVQSVCCDTPSCSISCSYIILLQRF